MALIASERHIEINWDEMTYTVGETFHAAQLAFTDECGCCHGCGFDSVKITYGPVKIETDPGQGK